MKECNLHGFIIEKSEHIDYIRGDLVTLRHEKTKMPLFFLDREDTNKTFAIGFLTEPEDDSGVFHIIEHSVLCGSKKFPVKEPFADLMRGTVSTYLNALTYSTFTLYPVSSMVDKALFDMMDVYLDAVFNPLVLENELIFLQEGHRLELDENGYITPNGVVLNEMREDYNSLGEIISRESDRLLHPNDGEGYVSGGVPKNILGLTYEHFCEILRHYYHPSNAFCMLDGSVDLERALGMIDEYISVFAYKNYPKKKDDDEELTGQRRTVLYQIAEDEEPTSKLFLYSKLPRGTQEEEDLNAAAITVIANAICATNSSPLKSAVLDTGLCNNMSLKLLDVTTVEVLLSGIEPGKEDECATVFRALLAERLDDIISNADLVASINAFDFAFREQDSGSTPRGVVYISNMAEYFADGNDVAGALLLDKHYSTLRTLVGTDFFRSLAHSVLLDAPSASLCLNPTIEEQDDGVDETIEAMLAKLSAAELEKEIEKSRALENWQSTPDSEEALATIPSLLLSDLKFIEDTTPTLNERIGGVSVLHHPLLANDISYMDLLFDVSDLSIDELMLLQLYLICIADFGHKDVSPEWLEIKTNAYLGARSRSISLYHTRDNETRVALAFYASFLDKYATEAMEVMSKYISLPVINDPSIISFKVKQWLDSRKKALRNGTVANRTATMGYDNIAYIRHSVYGIGLFDWINKLGPNGCAELADKICPLLKKVLTKNRLTIGITGMLELKLLAPLVDSISDGVSEAGKCIIKHPAPTNKIILTSENVAKCAYVCPIPTSDDAKLKSASLVLTSMLEYDILWSEIRVKGGAYSTGIYINSRRGYILCFSSSDPTPERSLEIFKSLGKITHEYIKSLPDITKYIISAHGEENGITTPRILGTRSTDIAYEGRTLEASEEVLSGILSVTKEDLLSACDQLFCLKNGHFTVMCDEEIAKRFEGSAEIFYNLK